jgi:hypothetical protein
MTTQSSVNPLLNRKALTARIVNFLMAGAMVQIGSRVFALREAGETIYDELDNACETLMDGLYERIPQYSTHGLRLADFREPTPISHEWFVIHQGASARRPIAQALRDLSDNHIENLAFSLSATSALLPKHISNALVHGIRLDDDDLPRRPLGT